MKYLPDDMLTEAARLRATRDKEYGETWRTHGETMATLFPEGITIKTAADWTRLHMIMMVTSKLRRYCRNFDEGGHCDSAIDAANYWAMLRALDLENEDS